MRKLGIFLFSVSIIFCISGCDRNDDSTDNPTNPTNPTDPTNPTVVGGFDENGASNAVFSVADGRTVRFSKGNLQYQASTGTWRFAEHQYDISSTYSGWNDLFEWDSCGWNGVNMAGDWRVLTKDEWDYLLYGRSSACRYAMAKVNGVNGLIIFPDTFTILAGVTITNINVISTSYGNSSNIYTESQWNQMESCGYIFLPAAGYRNGTDVLYVGTLGYYWSSSYNGEGGAWFVDSDSGIVGVFSNYRTDGRSVRLVRD